MNSYPLWLFFDTTQQWPQQLIGHLPTIISVVANIVLAVLLQRRSVVMAEYSALEKICTRQREDIKNLNQEIGKWKERTDLAPIMTALVEQNKTITEWRDEGRERFNAATEQLRTNTEAVKTLTELMIVHLNNQDHDRGV